MREEYDFTASVPNPYAKKLKQPVTIRLEEDVVDSFKDPGQRNRHSRPDPD